MSGIGEATSWLDWWLSTFAAFHDSLSGEARANFERLLVSGSKTLEFLGSQAVPALGNLVLSRRDSLLSDMRSTVPAEELSVLRHTPLPPLAAIFPPNMLDTALSKMRAASKDALIHKALHQPRIPKRPAQGQGRAPSSTSTAADRAGTSPLVPRPQQTSRQTPSSSSLAGGKANKGRKGKRPFSQTTGHSGSYGHV